MNKSVTLEASEHYTRGERINEHIIVLAIDGVEIKTTKDVVCRSLAIDSIIRIRESEYPDDVKTGDLITHFGLHFPLGSDLVGQRAVLARIIRNGFHDATNKVESLPLLQLDESWIGRIETSISRIAFQDIPGDLFSGFTVGAISGPDDLRQRIFDRYAQSTSMTREEILRQDVSIRQIRLEKKVDDKPLFSSYNATNVAVK